MRIHFITQWKKTSVGRDFDIFEFGYVRMSPLENICDYKGFTFMILGLGFNFWFKNRGAGGR